MLTQVAIERLGVERRGIGLELGLIDAAGNAALVGAGLLSVVIFPATALALLQPDERAAEPAPAVEDVPLMAM
jgi:hypothetical protein